MSKLQTIKAGICLAALMGGTAAQADVTALEVWENLKANMDVYGSDGISIESEDISNGAVTIKGLSLSMSDDDASMNADIGDIVFTENGDGTVDIAMDESYTMSIKDQRDDGFDMIVSQSGLDLTASGTSEAINYDLTADQYSIALDQIVENGAPVPADVRFAANDLAGKYAITMGQMRDIAYSMTAGSMDILMDIKDDDSTALVSGKINGIYVDATGTIPDMSNGQESDEIFQNGLALSATYGLESGSYIFDIDEGGEKAAGTVQTGPADASIAINKDTVEYSAQSNDIAFVMNVPNFPFPIDVSLAEYGIGLNMPLSKTDAPADFGVTLNLTDLAVNDEIWMMGDPAGALPHDPITAKFDITGTAKLFFDLLDPAQADAIERAEMPGELNSLTLTGLTVNALGAAITGTGAFTFDNSDFQTIPDMPRPEGEVTINIDGANTLMDTLISMGLLPQDQAMGARMMMGMFARTVGDDQLISTIEINGEGHIIANGQRIK